MGPGRKHWMCRPKPTVLRWRINKADIEIEEVITAQQEAVHVVLLDGQTIGLKRRKLHTKFGAAKYVRTPNASFGSANGWPQS